MPQLILRSSNRTEYPPFNQLFVQPYLEVTGCKEYRQERALFIRIDELLQSSGLENDFIDRCIQYQGYNVKKATARRLDSITLRYIKLGYENRAGEKAALVVVTDLLDPQQYPAEEMADLYMERWQVEVKFRDINRPTLQMEKFDVHTPRMVHKTLAKMVIAYNLLRSTMQEAAGRTGKKVHEMSVEGIRSVLTTSHESFRAVAGKPKLFGQLYDEMIKDCEQHILDIRQFRREPRALKRRLKNYQLLTAHRRIFQEVQHRSTAYRKPKRQSA